MIRKLVFCVLAAVIAFSTTVFAVDSVTDISFSDEKLSIEYDTQNNKYSKLLIVGYDAGNELAAVDVKKFDKEFGYIDIDIEKDISSIAIYGIEKNNVIKLLKNLNKSDFEYDITIPDGAGLYESCDVPLTYIGGLKRGGYGTDGVFYEGNNAYSSDMLDEDGMTISVETYYHTYMLDIISKNDKGEYEIKHTNSDVYTFGKNDCAFMVVKADETEMTDNDINTIKQRIRLSSKTSIEDKTDKSGFSAPFTLWPDESKNNNYECWPFGNCWYDESDDTVNIIYTAGSDHLSYIGKFAIYLRKIYSDNSVSEAVPVTTDENIGYNAFSSNMLLDGTYIAAIYDRDNKINYIYKSRDKGNSWSHEPMVFDWQSEESVVSVTGIKEIGDNYIIGLAKMSDKSCIIIKSIDGGITWMKVTDKIDQKQQPLEGTFIPLSNNRLICIMRGTLGQSIYPDKAPTYMVRSEDNGQTWSELIELNGIDASYNPVAALYHADSKTVELLYGSRYAREDYCGSINHMIIAEDDLWNADFSNTEEERLYKAPATRDFGYFAMAETRSGTIKAFFYSGQDANTNIYCMIKQNG